MKLEEGKNEFSHWKTDNKERAPEELKISDFIKEDTFYTSTGEEIKYTNGFDLSAKFEGKALKESGYERYKNVTLYASWTKRNDTVKEIKSNGNAKASVVFDKEVSKNYVLDIKPMEIKKSLMKKMLNIY